MLHLRPILAVLLVLAGCGTTEPQTDSSESLLPDAPAAVTLSVDRAEYSHGDTVRVVLRNASDQAVGHNLCGIAREVWTGEAWRRVEWLRLCTAAIYTLAPGQEARALEPITGEWEAGRTRLVLAVEMMEEGRRVQVRSDTFTVNP